MISASIARREFRTRASSALLAMLVAALVSLVGVGPAGATLGTNDYPANLANAAQGSVIDPWLFYNRECVSFVAWRLVNDNRVAFSNNMIGSNGVQGHWGNAYEWKNNAIKIGYSYN